MDFSDILKFKMNEQMANRIGVAPGTNAKTDPIDRNIASLQKNLIEDKIAAGKEQEKALLSYINRPKKVDLSPLIGLADAWGGGNLSQTYRAPATEDERAQEAIAARKQISDQKDDTLNALSKMSKGITDLQLAKMLGTQDRFDSKERQKLRDKFRDELSGVIKSDDAMNDLRNINMIENNLMIGDSNSVTSALSNMARLYGEKGVLTDRDTKRVLGATFKGDIQKFKSYLFSNYEKADPAQLNKLFQLVDVARQEAAGKAALQVQATKSAYDPEPMLDFGDEGIEGKLYNAMISEFQRAWRMSPDDAIKAYQQRQQERAKAREERKKSSGSKTSQNSDADKIQNILDAVKKARKK